MATEKEMFLFQWPLFFLIFAVRAAVICEHDTGFCFLAATGALINAKASLFLAIYYD